MRNTLEELKELPPEVQEKVARTMGGGFGYREVNVELEYGRYSVSPHCCLRNYYAPDFKAWTFNREDVRKDEHLNSFINEEDVEYERWLREEGKDFDWEAFGQ